jgi:hypothetical protein
MVDVETCPTLEDIAAFLDGRLSAGERLRLTQHLADCRTCLEVLAGAADFLASEEASAAEEQEVAAGLETPPSSPPLPFRRPHAAPASPWGKRLGYGLAAAAALAAAAVPVWWYYTWQPALAAGLVKASTHYPEKQAAQALAAHLYEEPTLRGAGSNRADSSSLKQAFMLGVELVDLRVALEANDPKPTAPVAQRIWSRLQDSFVDRGAVSLYQEAMGVEESHQAPRALLTRANLAEEKVAEAFSLTYLPLGRWAEAARLAASMPDGDQDFLKSYETRRFLAWVLEQKEESLDDATQDEVKALRARLSSARSAGLADELAKFIDRHYEGPPGPEESRLPR